MEIMLMKNYQNAQITLTQAQSVRHPIEIVSFIIILAKTPAQPKLRLCRLPQGQHHPKVCGPHRIDRMHHWRGRSGLQEGGGQSGSMVWQQPHPQHGQDKGDDSGYEEEEGTSDRKSIYCIFF